MHEILIVEDSDLKFAAISNCLTQSFECNVIQTKSISAAYSALKGKDWSLIILDMTFPISAGSGKDIAKDPLAGIEVLQYLQASGTKVPVIVATQHNEFSNSREINIKSVEELHDILKLSFKYIYNGTVKIDPSAHSNWKKELLVLVRKVFAKK